MFFKRGFTLNEILITFGILGLVSALVIPNMVQNAQRVDVIKTAYETEIDNTVNPENLDNPETEQDVKKKREELNKIADALAPVMKHLDLYEKINRINSMVKVKNIYSTLANIFELIIAENGSIDKLSVNFKVRNSKNLESLASYITPYLDIIQDCGVENTECIYDGTYKKLDGSDFASFSNNKFYKFVVKGNIAVWFTFPRKVKNTYAVFYVDINGKDAPNKFGADLFVFKLLSDGKFETDKSDTCGIGDTGFGCAQYIMDNNSMRYLDYEYKKVDE